MKKKVKVALIDYKSSGILPTHSDFLRKELERRGLSVTPSKRLEDFERKCGPLSGYNGLLIHPGIDAQINFLSILKEYPALSCALITNDVKDYEIKDKRFPLFDMKNTQDIYDFLTRKR